MMLPPSSSRVSLVIHASQVLSIPGVTTSVPNRGKRNDPRNLAYICAKVAEFKQMDPEELASITLQNGKTLFNIP